MVNFDKRLKMIKEIDKVVDTDISTISDEDPYKTVHTLFVKKCNDYIRAIAKEHNWQVITKYHPFCEYSCFVKNGDKFVYVHLSDYRFWDWKNVLFRIAEHSQDYTGLNNHYCDLINLEVSLMELFKEEE